MQLWVPQQQTWGGGKHLGAIVQWGPSQGVGDRPHHLPLSTKSCSAPTHPPTHPVPSHCSVEGMEEEPSPHQPHRAHPTPHLWRAVDPGRRQQLCQPSRVGVGVRVP